METDGSGAMWKSAVLSEASGVTLVELASFVEVVGVARRTFAIRGIVPPDLAGIRNGVQVMAFLAWLVWTKVEGEERIMYVRVAALAFLEGELVVEVMTIATGEIERLETDGVSVAAGNGTEGQVGEGNEL